jgi:hypothetical protein
VRIVNSINSCLQDVLEFTPTIELNTRFCILSILIVNSPHQIICVCMYVCVWVVQFKTSHRDGMSRLETHLCRMASRTVMYCVIHGTKSPMRQHTRNLCRTLY